MSMTDQIQISPVKPADDEASKVFEDVKADVLHKIKKLYKSDEIHDLNEVHKLHGVKMFELISYRVEQVPYGVNYYGKIQLNQDGDCIHARVFRPAEGKGPVKFHSIQTRIATEGEAGEGGAIFSQEEPLRHFEY